MKTHPHHYRIALIPGDGIGREVVPEGVRVLEKIGARFDISFEWQDFDWSCERYARLGAMMPEDGISQIAGHDAIFLGAVGFPGVPDHVSLWGLLIPIRREFHQYINLRPVRLFDGVHGVDRVLKYAFELAQSRPARHLTSATKSNGIIHTMPFWDERVEAMAEQYPEIKVDKYHIDILTAHFVRNPHWFDVVVGSNLFGDILSDLGPACTGTIGIAPSANLNPERDYPSCFEPVHGSAPDIAGQGIANPIGQIWSGAMMLDHLGHRDAHDTIVRAIEQVLADPDAPRTPDMGGKATTVELGEAIASLC